MIYGVLSLATMLTNLFPDILIVAITCSSRLNSYFAGNGCFEKVFRNYIYIYMFVWLKMRGIIACMYFQFSNRSLRKINTSGNKAKDTGTSGNQGNRNYAIRIYAIRKYATWPTCTSRAVYKFFFDGFVMGFFFAFGRLNCNISV